MSAVVLVLETAFSAVVEDFFLTDGTAKETYGSKDHSAYSSFPYAEFLLLVNFSP